MASTTLLLPAELMARLPKLTAAQKSSGSKLVGMMMLTGNPTTGEPVILDAVVVGPKRAGTLAKKASLIQSMSNGRAMHAVPFDIEQAATPGGRYSRSDWMFGSIAAKLPPVEVWQAIRRNITINRMYPFAADHSERTESVVMNVASDEWNAAGGKDAKWSSGESVAVTKSKPAAK